jgi:hypothetical protein
VYEKIRDEYHVLAVKCQAKRPVEGHGSRLEDNIKVMTKEDSLS